MKLHFRQISRVATAGMVFAAAVLPLSRPGLSQAQQTATQRRDERRADMEARQRALRSLSASANRPPRKQPDTRPTYQQVAGDFQQLQLSNYQLAGTAVSKTGLDYVRIAEDSAEVRRRASRLKSALALPAVKKDEKQKKGGEALTPEGVKAAIASLDALVNSFVWNPVFQKPDVLDAENSAKASRELEDILRLSEEIRRSAETLGKGKNF
jgi:hypothetical protein